MAKKKNTVKSAPKSIRQALLAAKTAVLNFSSEHILFLSYDPSSKAMTVRDIPADLESQFTLGESGGGSLDLHPKITMNVTIEGNSASYVNNAIILDEEWVVIQGNNAVNEVEKLDADNLFNFNDGDTKEVTCVLASEINTLAVYRLVYETSPHRISFSNCVNCTGYDNRGELEITDRTQDASADVTLSYTDED